MYIINKCDNHGILYHGDNTINTFFSWNIPWNGN